MPNIPFSVSTVSQIHKPETEATPKANTDTQLTYAKGPVIATHLGYATSFEYCSHQDLKKNNTDTPCRAYGYTGMDTT